MRLLPNMSHSSLLGGEFGKAIGGGLSSGLDALAEHKMQEIAGKKIASGIAALKDVNGKPLFNHQESTALAGLPPQIIQTELANRGKHQVAMAKYQMELQQQQEFQRALQGGYGYPQQQDQQQRTQTAQHPLLQQPQGSFRNEFEQNRLQNMLGMPTGLPQKNPVMELSQQPQSIQNPQAVRPKEARAPKSVPVPIGLTPQQHMQYLSHQDKEQTRADATNKKYLEEVQSGVTNARNMIELVDEMDSLLATGKVATGIKGKLPTFAQNAETQQYAAKANELAILLASSQRGVPSAYRIRVAQTTKPNIEQNLLAQRGLQDDIRKKALDVIKRGDIIDQIISENGNYQPPNISSIVNNRYKSETGNYAKPLSEIKLSPIIHKEKDESSEESPAGTLVRGALRTGARLIEPVGEQLQNVASLGLGAANYLTGGATPTYGELREKYPFLPPAQLSEVTNKITKGYLEPKNAVEEFIDNIASTTGTLASSILGGGASAVAKGLSFITNPKTAASVSKLVMPFSGIPWKKALTLGIGSETVGKVLEGIGASPTVQSLGKLATLFFGSTGLGKGAMLKSAEENYAAAEKAGSKKFVNVIELENNLERLKKMNSKSFDPYKPIVSELIDDAQKSLQSNTSGIKQIPINKLVEIKREANKWYGLAENPRVPGEKHLPKGARKIVGQIVSEINKPIAQYGMDNPSFGKPYIMGEDIWKAVHDVDVINKWLDNSFSTSLGLKTALPKAAALGATAFGIGKLSEYANLFYNHPVAWRHLAKAVQAASKQDATAFGREVGIMEKEANKIKD